MQKGLSEAKAAELLEKYGENVLESKKRQSAPALFLSQFKDLLTLILLVSAAVSLFLSEFIDAVTIFAIVFINAVLGFLQEYKTERTLEKLREFSAPKARVYRDGKKKEIPSSMLVPGDVVILSTGCRVPADGEILSAVSLSVDESLLTGESVPAEKRTAKGGADISKIRPDCVYMGTSVAFGHGEFRVLSTGMSTQMGAIADLLKSAKTEQTPLQKKLASLSKYIAALCIIICAAVTALGIIRGEPAFDMFLTGLSLSVAAIPEGLTAVITISLGLAVSRMLKKNALVRKLHSVETLGCANVICSDKTGTLTENRMTVTRIFLPAEHAGKNLSTARELLFECAALCNNAEANSGKVSGEPTEAALLRAALEHGVSTKEFRRTGEIPFDSARKLMSVAVSGKKGDFVFTKGAPDVLLPLCSSVLGENGAQPMTDAVLREIRAELSSMAAEALRVLALAYKPQAEKGLTEKNLIFIGLCGIFDPPRRGARSSVLKCKKAGIRTVMITGDHPATALAVAKKIGIADEKSKIYSGAELDSMGEKAFSEAASTAAVFARVTPAHKLKIVRALKNSGAVVAMTGDGVNDAPAVKEADIGVAMGKNGTDVTREASGIVLLDDDFSTLVSAVEEGRIIYGNIRKFIRYLLSCNIGEVVTMFFGMLFGLPAVLLPIHILTVNLVTDGVPAIALSFDPPQDNVMLEKPRSRNDSVFSEGLGLTIVLRGFLLGFSVLGAFIFVLKSTGDLALARSAAFLSLVLTQLVHVFECKSEHRSLFTIRIWNNPKLVLAVLSSLAVIFSVIFVPFLQPIFKTVALGGGEMLAVLIATLAVPLICSTIMFIRKGR